VRFSEADRRKDEIELLETFFPADEASEMAWRSAFTQ
jgi:hypothetical protein